MPCPIRRAQVGEVGDHLECRIQFRAGKIPPQRRISGNELPIVRLDFRIRQQVAGRGTERVHHGRIERLSAADCSRRWPQIDFNGVPWSVHEPDSGFLAARRACEAVLQAFIAAGGVYRQAQASPGRIIAERMLGILIGSDEMLSAESLVFAPGPWLGQVFPFLSRSIIPTRQEVFYFGPPAGDDRRRHGRGPLEPADSQQRQEARPGIFRAGARGELIRRVHLPEHAPVPLESAADCVKDAGRTVPQA